MILEERRNTAFNNVYDEYVEEISAVFNKKMWKKISAEQENDIKTNSFFEIIDRVIENQK